MNIYMYRADLYCEECAEKIKQGLPTPEDVENESSYDSDDYPKGPFDSHSDNWDTPHHCAECEKFLEVALSNDGFDYVKDRVAESGGRKEILKKWKEFYLDPNENFQVGNNVVILNMSYSGRFFVEGTARVIELLGDEYYIVKFKNGDVVRRYVDEKAQNDPGEYVKNLNRTMWKNTTIIDKTV